MLCLGAMSIPVVVACLCVCAYLLGSIPFGLIVARMCHVDLRRIGSGNIGATNAARALGKGLGLCVLLLDAGKAALPVYLCTHCMGRLPGFAALPKWTPAATALAVFLGHLYPLFAGFRGGKGVATALGGFLVLEPIAALLGCLVYALSYGLTRISSVGSLLGVFLFPLWLYLTAARWPSYALSAVLALFIVWRHRSNIERLLAHKEQRV